MEVNTAQKHQKHADEFHAICDAIEKAAWKRYEEQKKAEQEEAKRKEAAQKKPRES